MPGRVRGNFSGNHDPPCPDRAARRRTVRIRDRAPDPRAERRGVCPKRRLALSGAPCPRGGRRAPKPAGARATAGRAGRYYKITKTGLGMLEAHARSGRLFSLGMARAVSGPAKMIFATVYAIVVLGGTVAVLIGVAELIRRSERRLGPARAPPPHRPPRVRAPRQTRSPPPPIA